MTKKQLKLPRDLDESEFVENLVQWWCNICLDPTHFAYMLCKPLV